VTGGTRPIAYVHLISTRLGTCAALQVGERLVRTVLPASTTAGALRRLAAPDRFETKRTSLLAEVERYLIAVFDGDPRSVGVPDWLDLPRSGRFFDTVYHRLLSVPAGKVVTYQALAKKAESPAAVRAVGQAMANNPLPPIVPCHRVIRSDGTLGGYSAEGGLSLKRWLLEREGVSFDADGRVRF
jgi:methylated-DNA-[protein]-cysteine S-methyltransferase